MRDVLAFCIREHKLGPLSAIQLKGWKEAMMQMRFLSHRLLSIIGGAVGNVLRRHNLSTNGMEISGVIACITSFKISKLTKRGER